MIRILIYHIVLNSNHLRQTVAIHGVHNSARYVRKSKVTFLYVIYFTIDFKPPEPEYVYQSDIWALGCTIIEMLTGKVSIRKN